MVPDRNELAGEQLTANNFVKTFTALAERGGLLFDGAVGSLLYERGVFITNCFENVCLTQPTLVRQIHDEYVQAGADVICTNTFGANRLKLEKHGLGEKLEAIIAAAVLLAREASGGRVFVGGSIGPSGLKFDQLTRPEGRAAYLALEEQSRHLVAAGVDLLVYETFTVLQELESAVVFAKTQWPELPVVANYTFRRDGKGWGGQTPEQVARRLIEAGADVVGANCGGGPDLMFQVTAPMVGLGRPVMAQANAGRPEVVDGRTIYVANPEYFGVFARRLLKNGVKVIGGCCGTSPEHIRRMANAARMMSVDEGAMRPRIEGGGQDLVALPEVPLADRSTLGFGLANGRFVTSVELNPPVGFALSKRIEAAQALSAFGVTTINIADGPRASVRMGNVAMAKCMMEATELSPIVHLCCRDRSFLGLQSHLLGMHVLGIRNLVVITGDPPKMGPYPHSTGVYDVDSIGLLNMISGFNHGVDPAGKMLKEPTEFVCATGAEPAAIDYERELRRLEMKRDAGAHVVMTQPVYDPLKVERFLDDAEALGLPVMLGLCPLASYRNAAFLHKNVPGMQVPQYILDRMQQADERGEGQAEGVRIAREALSAVRHRVQGAYIMPPFGRYKVAMAVLDGFMDD